MGGLDSGEETKGVVMQLLEDISSRCYDEHKIWDARAISIRLRAKFSSARCVSLFQPTVDAGYQTLQKAREAG